MLGGDGPAMLTFEIMGIGEQAPRAAGVFIYARQRSGVWQALYIGESANLSARLAFNEIAADALLSGATDIHILRMDADASERRDLADRLIVTNAPSLNEEDRVRLSVESKHTEQKKSTRAA